MNIKNVYACIHLASIANDPMVDLDQSLSWETSALGTKLLVDYLIENKVKKNYLCFLRFSLWNKKRKKKFSENLSLQPISTYNKVKMVTERLLLSYKKKN